MNKKYTTSGRSIWLCLFALFLMATSVVSAQTRNTDLPNPDSLIITAPAGTYVIAMDNTLQANPGYFNVKAYGLLVTILNNRHALHWVIKSGKAKDGIDFTATATRVFPTFAAAATRNFKAGPFLILPIDSQGISAIINTFNNTQTAANRVNVYQLTAPAQVDVRYILTQIPRAAIMNDGGNQNIHASYFTQASVPSTNYRITAAVRLDDSCYTFASEPHSTEVGPTIDSIHAYVHLGGNFLAQCKAVNTYENQPNGRFQTTLGVTITNSNIAPIAYPNPDLSFSQYEGLFDPRAINGSERNWRITAPGTFKNSGHMHETGSTTTTNSIMGASVSKVGTGTGHLVFYCGAHDYSGSTNINSINGIRSYFNAMLTPSGVAKCNFLRFDNDLQVTKTATQGSVFVSQKDTFIIIVKNNGPSEAPAQNVALTDLLPAGFNYFSSTLSQGSYNPATGVWTVGVMNLNERDTLRIIATATSSGVVTNTAFIVKDQYDLFQNNDTARATVTIYGCAVVDAGRDATICSGSSAVLGGAPTATAGTPPYTYNWLPVTGLNASNIANPTASPTGTTMYVVSVTDNLGCTTKDTVVITVIPSPTISASSNSPAYCSGETINLNSTPAGGTIPYTFKWSHLTDTFSTAQNPERLNSTTNMSGIYSVTVTDVNLCSATAVTSIIVYQSPSVTASSSKTEYCSGENLVLNSVPSGGAGGYSFAWSGPLNYISSLQNNFIPTATVGMSGIYTVTVTDANLCTAAASTPAITVHASPAVTAASNTPVCETRSIELTASPASGTLPYSYSWSGPVNFSSVNQNPTIANVVLGNGGTYTVTVTDFNGCTGSGTTDVTVLPKPGTPVAFISPNPVCTGQTLYLTGTGNNNATWNWIGPDSFTSNLQNDSITNTSTANGGQYLLYQTLSGCSSDTVSVSVTVNITPAPPVLTTNGQRCFGDTLKLFASDITGASYLWSGPLGYVSTAQNPIRVLATPAMSGSYSVTVTMNGCASTIPDTVDALVISCPPVASDDVYTTPEDVTLVVSAPGVLTNDYDPANPEQPIAVNTTLVTNPVHGTVTVINANGSFTYVPALNFNGLDSFVYGICDNEVPPACDTATVYINVSPVNDSPVARDDYYISCIDTNVIKNVLVNDDSTDGPLMIVTGPLTGPYVGTLTLLPNGDFEYDPTPFFNLLDSFTYVLCDGGSPDLCDSATVILDFTCTNVPPVAVSDHYTTNEDQTLINNVSTNDYDPDGGGLVYNTVPVTDVTNGSLAIDSTGVFTYIPNTGFFGTDSFVYEVCDNDGPPTLCDTATVYITILHVNHPPLVPDTTVHTPEDSLVTICVNITDVDTMDSHTATVLCNATHGTVTSGPVVNNSSNPHEVCITYTPVPDFFGTDIVCIKVCDNGNTVLCDTGYITIIVDPRNDPPYADTIIVYTYQDNPVGVNVASATGDPEGDPLTYTYGSPTPGNGTVGITGNGAIVVTPNTGFTGTFTIPYSVCDLSPYPVNVLCDNSVIIVNVLPPPPFDVNGAPVAANDFATTPVNTAVVVNELANDYDPNGDYPLQVTLTCPPKNGTASLNPGSQTVNYIPNFGFVGFDTICYTVCDPNAASSPPTLPRPLCSSAIIVVSVSTDTSSKVNDAPVATDDFAFICTDGFANINLLQNDNDPNGNAIPFLQVFDGVDNGSLFTLGFGIFHYTPNSGFSGNDTLQYVICDNGIPSLCDTGVAVIRVYPLPVITPSANTLTVCSNDSVNIALSANIPGTVINWTASNGASGAGDIHTVLVNNSSSPQIVTYTVKGMSLVFCEGVATIQVTVNPRPVVTATANGNQFCSGDLVAVNLSSNVSGTTFTWSGSNGSSGTGNFITDNPVNSGTANITVTYSIVPLFGNCYGDTLTSSVTIKPRPVITTDVSVQTVCSGSPFTINISSNIPGTLLNWTGTNGNSGNTYVISDSVINNFGNQFSVYYTVNGSYNGCNANTASSSVLVRPKVVADAGSDKTALACSGSCVNLGSSPSASGGSGNYTYLWAPATGLNDATIANPVACGLTANTTFSLVVRDSTGCFSAADLVTVFVAPSPMTAEAGSGGNICLGAGDSVMLGGFPTVIGGTPTYTYAWSPSSGLNVINQANPEAYPASTTKYYVTVTDYLGCTAVDSATVNVYPALTVNAGGQETACAGSLVTLGGSPTATGGSGTGYTYLWSPLIGISNATVANPVANAYINTTYVVTVTDGNGCSATGAMVLTVNESPNAFAGQDKEITNCIGDTVTIGTSPAATGGLPPYTYQWSPSTGLSDTTIARPVVSGITTDQQYALIVTDANGCMQADYVEVTVLDRLPTISINLSADSICPDRPVAISSNYSGNTTNIQWSHNGNVFASGLNPVIVTPTGTDYCVLATAFGTGAGCIARDTACVIVLDNCITVHIDTIYDTIPINTSDTICVGGYVNSGSNWTITILCNPDDGTAATLPGDTCLVFTPNTGFTGTTTFCIVVCNLYGCDTSMVIITVLDSTICHFPNTITPNGDGQNDEFEISCNEDYPRAEIRIYDRWGAEVYRSIGHYDNKWSALNQQGTKVPDGTYFYLYYFNDGSKKMKKGFIDIYR